MTAGRKNKNNFQSWCTPKKIIEKLNEFFTEINLDPCSNNFSKVEANEKIILPKDGLKINWDYKNIFVNPPYGKDSERKTTIKNWFEKSYVSHKQYKSEIILLVPVATNTKHWKQFVYDKANSVCFLSDSRLKFQIDGSEYNKGSPMACCLIYYGNDFDRFKKVFSSLGAVVKF